MADSRASRRRRVLAEVRRGSARAAVPSEPAAAVPIRAATAASPATVQLAARRELDAAGCRDEQVARQGQPDVDEQDGSGALRRRRASAARRRRRLADRWSRRDEPNRLVEEVAHRREAIGAAALEEREQLVLDAPPPVEQLRSARRSRSRSRRARSTDARQRVGLVGRQAHDVHEVGRPARRAPPAPIRIGWQRDRIVGSRPDGSSATRMNAWRSVGSSSALRSAFWICSPARSACSISTTRRSATTGAPGRAEQPAARGGDDALAGRPSARARSPASRSRGRDATGALPSRQPRQRVARATRGSGSVQKKRASRSSTNRSLPEPDGPCTSSVRPSPAALERPASHAPRGRLPDAQEPVGHALSITRRV